MRGIVVQELLRLPAVSAEVVAGFEAAMMATRSEKDQRNLIRRLLFNSGQPPAAIACLCVRQGMWHTMASHPLSLSCTGHWAHIFLQLLPTLLRSCRNGADQKFFAHDRNGRNV